MTLFTFGDGRSGALRQAAVGSLKARPWHREQCSLLDGLTLPSLHAALLEGRGFSAGSPLSSARLHGGGGVTVSGVALIRVSRGGGPRGWLPY